MERKTFKQISRRWVSDVPWHEDQQKLHAKALHSETPSLKPRHTAVGKLWDKVACTAHSLRVSTYIPQSWFDLCLSYWDVMKEPFSLWLPRRRQVRHASEWTHFPLSEAAEDTLLHWWFREMNHLLKSSGASCLTVLLLAKIWLGMGSRENQI